MQIGVGADHVAGGGRDVGAIDAGRGFAVDCLTEDLAQSATLPEAVAAAERKRAERTQLGEVVLDVGQEMVEHPAFGAADKAPLSQTDERVEHVAPEDNDGLLAVSDLHAGTGDVEVPSLEVVGLGD